MFALSICREDEPVAAGQRGQPIDCGTGRRDVAGLAGLHARAWDVEHRAEEDVCQIDFIPASPEDLSRTWRTGEQQEAQGIGNSVIRAAQAAVEGRRVLRGRCAVRRNRCPRTGWLPVARPEPRPHATRGRAFRILTQWGGSPLFQPDSRQRAVIAPREATGGPDRLVRIPLDWRRRPSNPRRTEHRGWTKQNYRLCARIRSGGQEVAGSRLLI